MSKPDNNRYIRIRLSQIPRELEEDVTLLCFKCGANGVSESLVYKQPNLTYDPKIIDTKFQQVDVYFNERPGCDFFDGIIELNQNIKWEIFEEVTKDWLEEWKKDFKPFKLVGQNWIVPSWLKPPEECEKPIFIDPGMAFGTGTHATTQMMSYFIHKLGQKYVNQVKDWSLIDVGTGTAILAMLAENVGFGIITGVEIDPEARRVAKENVNLNKMSSIQISDQQLNEISDQYDIVVANIIDGVLLKIKHELLHVLAPSGHLLLTGILQERDNQFFSSFMENTNLKVIQRIEKDEWVGYWLQVSDVSE